MIRTVTDRMLDVSGAFDHPMTIVITAASIAALALAPIAIALYARLARPDAATTRELYTRWRTWVILVPLMIGPVLLGPGCLMLAIAVLGMLCYHEFARATGLFRQRLISVAVVTGILALTFAALDHWYGLFVALPSLTIATVAIIGLLPDQPKGYLQRVALGAMCFALFGVCLGHLGYMGNDPGYRPIVLLVLLSVELNDIFAFLSGRLLGRVKLAPNSSPGKTLGGALGALVLTTLLVAVLGHFVFRGEAMDSAGRLLGLGALISVAGQFGDLVISSVKRDLGVKDLGVVLPGHGGLLDRFDSLLLVPPVVFHYVGYLRGFGLDEPTRIFTGP